MISNAQKQTKKCIFFTMQCTTMWHRLPWPAVHVNCFSRMIYRQHCIKNRDDSVWPQECFQISLSGEKDLLICYQQSVQKDIQLASFKSGKAQSMLKDTVIAQNFGIFAILSENANAGNCYIWKCFRTHMFISLLWTFLLSFLRSNLLQFLTETQKSPGTLSKL